MDRIDDMPPRVAMRAEAISAAAVGEEVEILVLGRAEDGTVVRGLYLIGPVAAKSLVLLLEDALGEISPQSAGSSSPD